MPISTPCEANLWTDFDKTCHVDYVRDLTAHGDYAGLALRGWLSTYMTCHISFSIRFFDFLLLQPGHNSGQVLTICIPKSKTHAPGHGLPFGVLTIFDCLQVVIAPPKNSPKWAKIVFSGLSDESEKLTLDTWQNLIGRMFGSFRLGSCTVWVRKK